VKIAERRGHQRLDVNGYAILKDEGAVLSGVRAGLKEVSLGGFSVSSGKPIDPDKIVNFEIATRLTYKPLFGMAKIKHVSIPEKNHPHGYKIGIEFLTVNQEILMQLMNSLHTSIA